MHAEPIIFHINEADCIVGVNEQWTRFAEDNDGGALVPEGVLGGKLWPHISGESVREIYRMLLHRVRRGHTVRFPFRCDSPGARRLFHMTVSRLEGGQVEFRSELVSLEHRVPVALFDASRPRDHRLIVVCGWYHRVEHRPGLWLEVEEAVTQDHHLEQPWLPGLTHGICPTCHEEARRNLGL